MGRFSEIPSFSIDQVEFFTGAHEECYQPTDDVETINGAGAVQVANLVSTITEKIASTGCEIPYAVAPGWLPCETDQKPVQGKGR
ncbi:MAG: hypothetical protein KAI97_09435 [Gemmatimonadetes bacterium]|nr:hypothetical protein [Gemmatimonadota bacterium]